jgi:rhodanese-related sulfurtransferase
VARITSEELRTELDAGADLVIVDLRHMMDHEAEPRMLPGAIRLPAEELEQRGAELPRNKPLVLYCS